MTDSARAMSAVPGVQLKPGANVIAVATAVSPARLFVVCFLGLALLYAVAPFSFVVQNFWWASLYVLMASGAFLIGHAIAKAAGTGRLDPSARGDLDIPRRELRRYYYLLLVLAGVGVVLRFYDQIYVRGLDFSAGLTEARLEAVQASAYGLRDAGPVAIIGAFLFSFIVVLPPIVAKWPGYFHWQERVAGFGMMLFLVADSILKGGTMTAIFALIYTFFCMTNNGMGIKGRGFLKYGRFAVPLLVLLFLGGSFFVERVNILHGNVQRYMQINQLSNFITFNNFALESVEAPLFGDTLFLVYWFLDYVLQPFSELAYLLQHQSVLGAAGGNLQFSVFFKAASLSGLISGMEDAFLLNPRLGKYQTFLGDALLDFGLTGALVEVFFCGLFAGFAYSRFQSNRLIGVFFLPLIQMVIVAAFLVNPFSGVATYFFVAIALTWLLIAGRVLRDISHR